MTAPLPASPLLARLRPYPVTALAAATLLSWTGRLGLAWSDRTLSAAGKVTATVPVVIFVAVGAVLVAVVVRRRGPDVGDGGRRFVRLAVLWTTGYWLVRLPIIVTHPADDRYTVGFKAFHTVLAVVAWALSALAWRSVRTANDSGDEVTKSQTHLSGALRKEHA